MTRWIMDTRGRFWPAEFVLCRVCWQPDNCGDCDHNRLAPLEVEALGGRRGQGYVFTSHPDRETGREKRRHLAGPYGKTLCGHPFRFMWGPTTVPLSPDCKACQRIAANKAVRFARLAQDERAAEAARRGGTS